MTDQPDDWLAAERRAACSMPNAKPMGRPAWVITKRNYLGTRGTLYADSVSRL